MSVEYPAYVLHVYLSRQLLIWLQGISWTTVRYMVGEVQYGGRVTDDYDKRLLNTYAKVWFSENLFSDDFQFYQGTTELHVKSARNICDEIRQLLTGV